MNKRSLIDLTALLDVILILFFAALLSLANRTAALQTAQATIEDELDASKVHIEQLDRENEVLKVRYQSAAEQLNQILQEDAKDVEDYREILSRVSKITIAISGNNNLVSVNNNSSDLYILRDHLTSEKRIEALQKNIRNVLNLAIDNRQKSDIIFIKVDVSDGQVDKFAVDFLIEQVQWTIDQYGREKVILSMWNQ